MKQQSKTNKFLILKLKIRRSNLWTSSQISLTNRWNHPPTVKIG